MNPASGEATLSVDSPELAAFWRARNDLLGPRLYTQINADGNLAAKAGPSSIELSFSLRGNAMEFLWDIVALVGHAIEEIFAYVETHHWNFGFLAGGYVFYLHDRALHARFDALDRRVDEIRKRLAVQY